MRSRPRTLLGPRARGPLTPEIFHRVAGRARHLWDLDDRDIQELGLACALSLLLGGELCCDEPLAVLRRVPFRDFVLEYGGLWMYIQPPGCTLPYPIFLSHAPSLLVGRLLVLLWSLVSDWDQCPFELANLDERRLLEFVNGLTGGTDPPLTLANIVAANRDILAAHYGNTLTSYLAAKFQSVSVLDDHFPASRQVRIPIQGPLAGVRRRFCTLLYKHANDPAITHGTVQPELRVTILARASSILASIGYAHGVTSREGLVRVLASWPLDDEERACLMAFVVALDVLAERANVNTVLAYFREIDRFMQHGLSETYREIETCVVKSEAGATIAQRFRRVIKELEAKRTLNLQSGGSVRVRYLPFRLWSLEELFAKADAWVASPAARLALKTQIWLCTRTRISELQGTTYRQIDVWESSVAVPYSKSHPGFRALPRVDESCWSLIRDGLTQNREADPDGRVVASHAALLTLRRFLQQFGMTPHKMRHLQFSRECLAGVPPNTMAASAGHSDLSSLNEDYIGVHHLKQQAFCLERAVVPLPAAFVRRASRSRRIGQESPEALRFRNRLPAFMTAPDRSPAHLIDTSMAASASKTSDWREHDG